MDPTPSVWDQLLRRASALRGRYRQLPTVPQSTWSLVNRAAQRFRDGALPAASDEGHFYALWTRAMYSVLNDLYRRQQSRNRRAGGPLVPLRGDEEQSFDEGAYDTETLGYLDEALRALGEFDERKAAVIAHRHVEELTWEEVGLRVDLSASGVRKEWTLAAAWLRRELKRRGVQVAGAEQREDQP